MLSKHPTIGATVLALVFPLLSDGPVSSSLKGMRERQWRGSGRDSGAQASVGTLPLTRVLLCSVLGFPRGEDDSRGDRKSIEECALVLGWGGLLGI